MRKVNIIMLLLLICLIGGSTYFIFFHDDGEVSIDYTEYKATYQKLKNQEEFTAFDDIKINAVKKRVANEKYTIYITLDNAAYYMNDIDLLIMDKIEKTAPLNLFYPSLGLMDDKHISLTNDDNTTSTILKGFNLNYLTPNNTETLLVYFSFTDNANVRHENFLEVGVTNVEA